MGFWSFRFLILKQRAIRAQIFVDLPRNSSLLLCLSLQLESNSFYEIHSICLMLPRSYQNSRLILGDGIFLSHFPLVDTLRGKQWPIMGSRHKLTSQSVGSFGHIARHWAPRTCVYAGQRFTQPDLPCIFDEEKPFRRVGNVVDSTSPNDFRLLLRRPFRHKATAQELCESRGGRPGLVLSNSPYVYVDVK